MMILSGLFHFPSYPFGLTKRRKEHYICQTTKECNNYRNHPENAPTCSTVPDAARRTRMRKNASPPTSANTYRGKRLISKIDLLEFLIAADDEPAFWAGKILPREYSKGVK